MALLWYITSSATFACENKKGIVMLGKALLVTLLTLSVGTVAASSAFARAKDKPNSGICKSGKQVGDTKNCKENGGTK